MKFALGFHSSIPQGAPQEVCQRALSCALKPVLTYMYSNSDCRLSVAQGTPMTEFLTQRHPEVNLLMAKLAKSGSLELFTSSGNNTILSLLPPKDRADSVERTTTLIRKTYGVRATTLWCYGQIWSPGLVATMKKTGLDMVALSSWDAIGRRALEPGARAMTELGKDITVALADDAFARPVSSYAQNEIDFASMLSMMTGTLKARAAMGRDILCMVNIDQLCQGASYNREDDEKLWTVFTSLFNEARKLGLQLSLARDLDPDGICYTPSGWYGRDACASGLPSFNEIFVLSEDHRYCLNRYFAIADYLSDWKKDPVLRKRLQAQASSLPTGPLFLCDTHASALSLSGRRAWWRTVIEIEKALAESDAGLLRADLDGDGLGEVFCQGRLSTAVFAPRGGSVSEFCSRELGVNLFDTVPSWEKNPGPSRRKRSFTDSFLTDALEFDLSDEPYALDYVNKDRTEFRFTFSGPEIPVSVAKQYRLTNQNLYLQVTITNTSDVDFKGEYRADIYFTLPGASAMAWDSRREPIVGAALSGIRSVGFSDELKTMQLSFSSQEAFSVREERRHQSEVTTLGSQQFYLYTKARLIFHIDLAPGGSRALNIVTRLSGAKEK